MRIPIAHPIADFDPRIVTRAIVPLRTVVRRIDVEAILGTVGWAALLFVIVQSGI